MSFIAGLFIGSLLTFVVFCVLCRGKRYDYEEKLMVARNALKKLLHYCYGESEVFPEEEANLAIELIDEE